MLLNLKKTKLDFEFNSFSTSYVSANPAAKLFLSCQNVDTFFTRNCRQKIFNITKNEEHSTQKRKNWRRRVPTFSIELRLDDKFRTRKIDCKIHVLKVKLPLHFLVTSNRLSTGEPADFEISRRRQKLPPA